MYTILVITAALSGFASALYTSSDDVVELTAANFNTRVLQSSDLWLVEFYAPWCGHCKSLAPEWKNAASALKGIVNIGAVDMVDHQSVGAPYSVQGFPTIKIFGANKQTPEDYNGARTAAAIVDSALSHLKSIVNERLNGGSGSSSGQKGSGGSEKTKSSGGTGDANDVIELTDSNFEKLVLKSTDMWLVEFFAPWCGHCKSLAPHWQSAASTLKGKVKLGALDSTVHTVMASRYGIQSYPTIKMFPVGPKDGEVSDFDGDRTAEDIVTWALDKLAEHVAAPEVAELTTETVLKHACEDHQLCIVSILPHILDCQSKCRNDYLAILTRLGEKHKRRMWGWVWAEAGSQLQAEEALNIGGFGYPAMVAINARKMKYSLMRGSFSEKGINEFLLEVAVGRSSTDSVKNGQLPNIVTSSAWDGKDGELPVEEDYDLDEDIEKVKQEL